jgi:hypothetical protein
VFELVGIDGGERKAREVRAEHVGPKERFGFNRHGGGEWGLGTGEWMVGSRSA